MTETDGAAENTDKVLWESESGKFPRAKVFIQKKGALGICFNGLCIVRPIEGWHAVDALTAKLHAAEEREASMRKALEDVRDHNFPMGALPEEGLSNASTFADKALSAAPEGRVEKLEVCGELLNMLYEKWEEGTPCYEFPEDNSGHLGNAFKLTEAEDNKILVALERYKPGSTCFKNRTPEELSNLAGEG